MGTNVASIVGMAAQAAMAIDMDMKEDWAFGLPLRYAVREIDCTVTATGLEFSFRNPGLAKPLPAGGIDEVIAELRKPSSPTVTSRYAPLDIQAEGDSLFILLKIVGPINMRFSATKKALTHKNLDDRDNYGRLRHVNATLVSEDALPECRIVCFVVDPARPPVDDYKHGFSLNVEIDQAGTEGPRTIAFEIDPDIRHPGGSQT